jgi:hypothetical protein
MSFKIRIEQNTNVTAIELKDGKLGYSKPIGNSQFAHAPLTAPMALDFPNLQHGYVKYTKGQQAEFVTRSYTEEWTDDEHQLMRGDRWRTVYLVPAASPELPPDKKQELRCYDKAITVALSECHSLYLDATEAANGMIPVVQHVFDHLGNHAFNILLYVPRPVERFGEPMVKQVIPFPKTGEVKMPESGSAKTPTEMMMERARAKMEATRKANGTSSLGL